MLEPTDADSFAMPLAPRASVIIPVKNRRDLLAAALDALDAQDYDDFEVIVVDDGSTDGSGELAAARKVKGRAVRVLHGGGRGAVAARQFAVSSARGDILAFTDSDCEPQPGWLSEAVRAFDAGADVVNGLTLPARPMLPLERSMASGLEGLYPTCNVLYRKSAFKEAGGFDQGAGDRWGFRADRRAKGDGFGEDTLLAWRVIRGGGKATYVPSALVHHAVFPPEPAELLSRTVRVAAFPAMVREVPELRDTLLQQRWQLGLRSRAPVYAFALMVLLRRRRLALVCLAWWTGLRLHELRSFPIPWRKRFAFLPAEMAIDAITAGCLAVGTVKARTITL